MRHRPTENTFSLHMKRKKNITRFYPEKATILLVPLVGNRRKAKSRDGSHISVSEFGRYPPTECVRVLVNCRDLRLKLDLEESKYRAVRIGEPIKFLKEIHTRYWCFFSFQ
jgi:hypothetical protein